MPEEIKQINHKSALRNSTKQGKYQLAKFLVDKYQIITVTGEKMATIFIYDNGIFVEGESFIRNKIQEIYQEEATPKVKNDVTTAIKDMTYTKLDEVDQDNYDLIPLKDGIFDLKTKTMLKFKPDYRFFAKLPVVYNEKADCPLHKKFFRETLDEKDIPLVQELFGFCLFRKLFLKKAFIFVGEKNTGKSTFLKTLKNMIGLSNICGVSLQKLSNDKFSIGNLFRKYANVYDDLDSQGINNHGSFKIASGGGIVSGEKKFGDEFQFISFAKSIFACNKIPDVKDINDDAYFDRWVIVNFSKRIEKFDLFLDEKLRTKEEISGLFNWSIRGLLRLLKNKEFTNALSSGETKRCMLKNSNSIASFAQDCLISNINATFVFNDEMYEAYRLYCMELNLSFQSDTKFHRDLEQYAKYVTKNTSSINTRGKQMRGYSNVVIDMNNRSEEDKTEEEKAKEHDDYFNTN